VNVRHAPGPDDAGRHFSWDMIVAAPLLLDVCRRSVAMDVDGWVDVYDGFDAEGLALHFDMLAAIAVAEGRALPLEDPR
jgi:hypothetical protein